MNYTQTLQKLYSLKRFGEEKNPARLLPVLERLGNPQKRFKAVHIVGTVGKGSVSAMISNILQNAGKRVGMFTSPHLIDFSERIQINGDKIKQSEVIELFELVHSEGPELKFFDVVTIMGFLCFAQNKVDYAVVEAGVGAKYDPTILCNPVAAAITCIDEDHLQVMGDIKGILEDKTEVIRNGIPVFSSIKNEKFDIIKQKAELRKSNLTFCEIYKGEIGLNGAFQAENAGIAQDLARCLTIDEKFIEEGLKTVKWPGRCQYLEENVLLDCAHNPKGMDALIDYADRFKDSVFIFGAVRTKNLRAMLSLIPSPNLILTEFNNKRCEQAENLAALRPAKIIKDSIMALNYAKTQYPGHTIIICGSCFLVGEILSREDAAGTAPLLSV